MRRQTSYSAVELWKQCPYRYRLRYLDKLEVLRDMRPDDPLTVGSAFHLGMEKGKAEALAWYKDQFPVIGDAHVTEEIKLGMAIAAVRCTLDPTARHEVRVSAGRFRGVIDYLEPVSPGVWDMLDFKYCAMKNIERYRGSAQLHVYKHFFEQSTGQRIRNLGYLCVPKVGIKQREGEELHAYRKRVEAEFRRQRPELVRVEYDEARPAEFLEDVARIDAATDYPKQPGPLCRWCEYQDYCERGLDYMILPSTSRRDISKASKRKIWIYGPSFSGKTTMLDDAPNPLNLNTDGNVNFVTMPVVPIRDEVTVEGRITKRKFAWEVFKEAIAELEKKQNDFQTVIVDLVEDTREMCRLCKYDEMGIQHESDSGYGKGWDIIKTEYLSTMRRFFNLDYENLVIVSHEIDSEIKKKSGQTITKVAPNIQEAIANKLAGMCDIVARVVVEDDGRRTLNFKSSEYIFGGGRLKDVATTTIQLSWEALCEVYDASAKPKRTNASKASESVSDAITEPGGVPENVSEGTGEQPTEEKPKRRERKPRNAETEPGNEGVFKMTPPEPAPEAEEPIKRVRKRRAREE